MTIWEEIEEVQQVPSPKLERDPDMKPDCNPAEYENLDKLSAEDSEDDLQSKNQLLVKNFWKNCSIISLSWMFLFMGYYPISAVQSSLNDNDGLGTAALSAKYGSMAIGNLITNNAIVDYFGSKWTMCIGMLMYSSYIAANYYPSWYTLIPFGVLSGIGGSAMWNAQGTYLTRLCDRYILVTSKGSLSTEERAAKLAKLKSFVFGLFNILYFGSNGLGNLVSSLILPQTGNGTTDCRLDLCGADYCNDDLDNVTCQSGMTSMMLQLTSDSGGILKDSSSSEPDNAHVYGLCTFCFGSSLIGVALLIIFIDRLQTMGVSEKQDNRSIGYLLAATVRNWANPYQLLLILLGLYNGMDSPFWSADYAKAFVTCPVGVHYVGYTVMCYGFTVPVFVFFFSWFSKWKPRLRFVPYLVALAAHLVVLSLLLFWKPNGEDIGMMYGMSVLWGVGSGCWYPMMYAFYSIVFRKNMEAGFSNFHLWSTLGSTLTYAWSYYLCMNQKIYIMMGIVSSGVICYLIAEFLLHRRSQGFGDKDLEAEKYAADNQGSTGALSRSSLDSTGAISRSSLEKTETSDTKPRF